jgi:hypothetical protein
MSDREARQANTPDIRTETRTPRYMFKTIYAQFTNHKEYIKY